MSHGGHSWHKKDWLTAAAIAGTAVAAPYLLPAATGAGAGAGVLGPAMEGAGVAGDAFMPGLLGTGSTVAGDAFMPAMMSPGMAPGSPVAGSGLLGNVFGKMNKAQAFKVGSNMFAQGQQQQPMQPMGPRPGMGQQVQNTTLYPQQNLQSMSEEEKRKLLALMQQQGGSPWTVGMTS